MRLGDVNYQKYSKNKVKQFFGTLVHNEFRFLTVSSTLSMEVTIALGKVNVLGSNLTTIWFFSNRKNFGLIIVCLCFFGLIARFKNYSFIVQTNINVVA